VPKFIRIIKTDEISRVFSSTGKETHTESWLEGPNERDDLENPDFYGIII